MSLPNALLLSRKPARAFFALGGFWGCFAAQVPVLKAQIGAGDAVFGTLLLCTALGLVSAMWLAPRIDRSLGRIGLPCAAILTAILFLIPGLVSSPLAFGMTMVAIGAASGLMDVLMNARVSDLEAHHSKSLMNANHGMFSLGYMCAALATGVAREYGVPPVLVFGCAGLVTLVLAVDMAMPVHRTKDGTGQRQAYPMSPVLICGVIVLIAFMAEATVEAWSALHIERTLDGGAAEGALGPAMLGLTMTIGRFSGQVITEKFSELRVVVFATLLSSVGTFIAATAPTPMVSYVGFGIMGLGVSVIGPIGLALVGQQVRAEIRTEAISKVAVIGFSGFFIAPMVMGFLSEWFGLRVAFACVSVLLLLVVPAAFALRRSMTKDAPVQP
ncbi:MFS transporter [Nereida sp. MMG025]|uniref:MFS transporter n=1 Tax=Nereida sp. MMG025 TaxID=2909981 RepID=UPI001F3C4259|nr:MFS transporter [Nereida sp. MMG025]MCF6445634.1 MFS transporter [Nereida sp. MMG025]